MASKLCRIISVLAIFISACSEDNSAPPISNPLPPSGCPPFDPSNQCGRVCVGYPPIPDLGTGFWRGAQGGLYPAGQNTRPTAHNTAGLSLANQIVPLNQSGVPDSSSTGAIVFLSVGLSNTEQEFGKFETIVDTVQDKNPYLRTVNGAQGGWEIDRIIDPNSIFWDSIDVFLGEQSFSNLQVQVIWYKEAEFQPAAVASDTSFPGYPDTLRDKFKITMNIIHDRFPNAKLCYIASRIYGGYDITGGNPEPFAYYTGWCVKWLIEDQINGDPDLAYTDPSAKSPWLSWGAYLWADGLTPRSDGLVWICPDDFKPDGRHPSVTIGREKVALLLLDFFRNDETAKIWFLKKP